MLDAEATNNYHIEIGDEIAVHVRVIGKVDGMLLLDIPTDSDRGQLSPRPYVMIDSQRVVGGSADWAQAGDAHVSCEMAHDDEPEMCREELKTNAQRMKRIRNVDVLAICARLTAAEKLVEALYLALGSETIGRPEPGSAVDAIDGYTTYRELYPEDTNAE